MLVGWQLVKAHCALDAPFVVKDCVEGAAFVTPAPVLVVLGGVIVRCTHTSIIEQMFEVDELVYNPLRPLYQPLRLASSDRCDRSECKLSLTTQPTMRSL